MAGNVMTVAFLCAAVAAGTVTGDSETTIIKRDVRPIRAEFGKQYEDDEIVRVHIVFDKEEVEETSLDEMIEKLTRELPEGALDVHSKKLQGYDITANVAFGIVEELREAAGVESVNLEERYEMFEPSQPVTDGQGMPDEAETYPAEEPDREETAKQDTEEEKVPDNEITETEKIPKSGNAKTYGMIAAGGAAAVAAVLYRRRKDKEKK